MQIKLVVVVVVVVVGGGACEALELAGDQPQRYACVIDDYGWERGCFGVNSNIICVRSAPSIQSWPSHDFVQFASFSTPQNRLPNGLLSFAFFSPKKYRVVHHACFGVSMSAFSKMDQNLHRISCRESMQHVE